MPRCTSIARTSIGKAKRDAYQQVFALDTPHKLTLDLPGGFVFDEHIYEGNTKVYRGAWRFNKHFLGTYAIAQFDGKKDFGEGEVISVKYKNIEFPLAFDACGVV